MCAVTDPFADVVPQRRGTDEATPSARHARAERPLKERPPIERVRALVAKLNTHNDLDSWGRREVYDEQFERLYRRHGLGMMWGARLLQSSAMQQRDEVGLQWEVRAIERHPYGLMLGRLQLMWDDETFATLLVPDAPVVPN